MSVLSLTKAIRLDDNTVKVLFLHNDLRQEFLIEWSNIHPETGKVMNYDIQIDCLSRSESLNQMVEDAIREGDGGLYLEMLEAFNAQDCESI